MVLICVYYGPFPWYFSYFAHTCGYNPSVDFCIVTDNIVTESLPPNVKIVHHTMEEVVERAERRLGLKAAIPEPYKLNDFKPAYALLFPELVEGYDYWGYNDIDIIFGDIRKFITPEVLEHDVISVRNDFLSGYFTLFKNTPEMARLFQRSKDYKKVLTTDRYFSFDETSYQWKVFTRGVPFEEIPSEVESMTHLVMKLAKQGELTAHFRFLVIERLPGRLKWRAGKLVHHNRKEVMFYHLIKLKRIFNPPAPKEKLPAFFNISPKKVYVPKTIED